MRFWDTSAIVPLCLDEEFTAAARELATEDPALVVWWATRTEALSALARRRREGVFTRAQAGSVSRRLELLSRSWSEVSPSDALRERAERLLAVHALRAADAFQLAAALLWARERPRAHDLVALDDRLRDAAASEGFRVLP